MLGSKLRNKYQLCIKPGIQQRGTECEERGEWGKCYIQGNVAKYAGECPQTFRGMSLNIPENVLKHSGECHQTFRGMSALLREFRTQGQAQYFLEFAVHGNVHGICNRRRMYNEAVEARSNC